MRTPRRQQDWPSYLGPKKPSSELGGVIGGLAGFLFIGLLILAANVAFLCFVVWLVVTLLQHMGVL